MAWTVHKIALLEYCVSCIPGNGVADGKNGDMILLAPPYNVTSVEIEELVSRISQAITHVLGS